MVIPLNENQFPCRVSFYNLTNDNVNTKPDFTDNEVVLLISHR